MRFLARFALITLILVGLGGILFGFHAGKMSAIAWITFTIGVVYGGLSIFLPERIRRHRLSLRPRLSFDELYEQYFQEFPFSKELLRTLWFESAAELKVDAELLRPGDRFAVELAVPGFPLVDANENLTIRLCQRMSARQQSLNRLKLATLRDYIETTARLETEITPV